MVQIRECPKWGESVTEGTVLEWHKQEGEYVSEGETVVEVSTDKIDAEVPAPASGVITKLLVSPDDGPDRPGAGQLDTSARAVRKRRHLVDRRRSRAGARARSGPTGEGDADLGDETPRRTRPSPA